jgi:DNA transposition AAA+ family ATPase
MSKENEATALISPEQEHGLAHANAIDAMATARRMVIPGDVVNRATQELPDEMRSAIRGMHAYAVENNLSNAEVGKLLKISDATVSLVFRGKYPGSVANVAKEMEDFLALMAKRNQGRKLQFIRTQLYDKMCGVMDAAREFQKIAFFFGDMQIGKTASLERYTETHNHGSTVYVRMPTGGALLHFLTALARKLRISEHMNITKLRERIIGAFDDRMLLIVDEAHQCIPESGRSNTPIRTIEFVREIFDEAHCGVILCATNVFRDAMEAGSVERLLKQTRRRRLCAMQLPDRPTRADLNIFAASYDLPPSADASRELESKVIDQEALGMWLTLLRMAAKLAAERRQKLKWDHVHLAYAGVRAMEGACRTGH